nr:FAD-binding domain-containing protein [Neisseria sp.]
GWQWAAGTGCDAQPYFRIFNPVIQSQKYDPDGTFIRRHVPELAHLGKEVIHAPWLAKHDIDTHGYPAPIVNHALNASPYWLQPAPYRNLAALTAFAGSLLLWRYWPQQDMAAFAAVLLLFFGALVAMAAVLLALRLRQSGTTVQCLLLMLWQIGLPLVLMSRLYHQAV